ncbi:sterol o-acyltransferase [Anaeramoeba ignava]|uniref:Sterol o-acyltransferase n=1 Tax=Anaeramoeba ignava TaxID=1746090 RepID=A0A9Q0LGK3_ANAIG|nr:sterol o-acyltransferase [Anaeramoeba ignava]
MNKNQTKEIKEIKEIFQKQIPDLEKPEMNWVVNLGIALYLILGLTILFNEKSKTGKFTVKIDYFLLMMKGTHFVVILYFGLILVFGIMMKINLQIRSITFYIVTQLLFIVFNFFVIHFDPNQFGLASKAIIATHSTLLSMKYHSFTIFYLRSSVSKKENYLWRFLFAPLLVYSDKTLKFQPKRREFSRIISQIVLGIMCMNLMYLIWVFQFLPIFEQANQCKNSLFICIVETWQKLIPFSCLMWFPMFYFLFHCWLNLKAELVGFLDLNSFYLDWWKSIDHGQFWIKWNAYINNWLKEHLYKDFRRVGFPRFWSLFLTFFISGLLHDFIIFCISGKFHPWITLILVLQIPLVSLNIFFPRFTRKFGNLFVWISIFIGISLVLTAYHFSQNSQEMNFNF